MLFRRRPPLIDAPRRLRFTGTCSRRRFESATSAVDFWYHSFYFDNGFEVRGDYNIARNIDEYGFPPDLTGMRVLDIGTASGWFAFYLEQLGADVTALELRSHVEIDTFGQYEPVRETDDEWMRSFAVMAMLLGSDIERVRGRVYDVSPELFDGKTFDLVFMGAILLHVRDPIGALMAARSVCRDRLIATNWFIPREDGAPADGYPAADLPSLSAEESGKRSWWRPNRNAYELWFRAAGFRTVDVSRAVTLTADVVRPEHLNSTQTLLLADARV